jgi:hypothetical protein
MFVTCQDQCEAQVGKKVSKKKRRERALLWTNK